MIQKISVFLLLTATTVYSSGNVRSFFDYTNQNPLTKADNCICFDDPGPYLKVPDVINVQNHGIERIVLYLYKDMLTKDVKMYIPSIEKQEKIPDLVYEYGDILEPLTYETIQTLLNSNPNEINNQKLDPDENSDELPLDSFTEVKYTNANNNVKPVDVNPYQYKVPREIFVPKYSPNTKQPQRFGDKRYPKQPKVVDVTNSRIPYDSPFENKDTINEMNENDPAQIEKFNQWFPEQMEILNEYNVVREQEKVNPGDIERSIVRILRDNDMIFTDNGVLVDSNRNVIDFKNLSIRPILIGSRMNLGNFAPNNRIILPERSQSPFIQAISVTTTYPYKVLGIVPLGKTYLSSLIEHDFINKLKNTPVEVNSNNDKNYINNVLTKKTKYYSRKNMKKNDKFGLFSENPDKQVLKTAKEGESLGENQNSQSEDRQKLNSTFNKMTHSLSNTVRPSSNNKVLTDVNNRTLNDNEKNNESDQEDDDDKFEEENLVTPSDSAQPDKSSESQNNQTVDQSTDENTNSSGIDQASSVESHEIRDMIESLHHPHSFLYKLLKKKHKLPIVDKIIRGMSKFAKIRSHFFSKTDDANSESTPYDRVQYPSNPSVVQQLVPVSSYYRQSRLPTLNPDSPRVVFIPVDRVVESQIPDGFQIKKVKVDSSVVDNVPYIENDPLDRVYPGLAYDFDFASRSGSNPGSVPENITAEDLVDDIIEANEDDDDSSDFRIIGGNAATGSGTPLNNKGRSGFLF